jgi:hypothetical protein
MLVAVLLEKLEPDRVEDIPTMVDEVVVDNAEATTVVIDPKELDGKISGGGSASSHMREKQ